MINRKLLRTAIVAGSAAAFTLSGCAFNGVNSLPLPGAVGRGSDATVYHVEIANVATLEPNSPVMMNDVVVGSVRKMSVKNWHADIEFSVQPGIDIPANAVASVGQTSLLGSMHLALNPPLGTAPSGKLPAGATIPLSSASTYPTTEQTLSSLAAVVNGGGLGQIGEVIHNFSTAMNGREPEMRDLLVRLNNFVGVLDDQRDNIVASIQSLNRLTGTFAGQRDVLTRALDRIPPAMDVLIKERPKLTEAMQKLGTFSETANTLANESQADLVQNLKNLQPALKSLADVGPDLDSVIEYAGHFPFTQSFIDRAIRGDYYNLFALIDLTVPKLKRTMFLGTRWADQSTGLVPTYGDPQYLNYTYDPLKTGVAPPPPDATPGAPDAPVPAPAPDEPAFAPPPEVMANAGPILPVVPPAPMLIPGAGAPTTAGPGQIFAGPLGTQPSSPAPAAPGGGG